MSAWRRVYQPTSRTSRAGAAGPDPFRQGRKDAQWPGMPSPEPLTVRVDSGPHPLAVTAVKAVHSAVFLAELAAILWLVITGILGRRDRTVALAAVAVAVEAAVFCGNGRTCPLTPLTERLGASRGAVSDIFLPDVVARTIPTWSMALVALAAVLHARSVLRSSRRR